MLLEVTGTEVRSDGRTALGVSNQSVAGIAVVQDGSTISEGRWQYKASQSFRWSDFPTVSDSQPLILLSNDLVRFVPSKSFYGNPGTLSARVIEDSQSWERGLLSSNKTLNIGGFGSASEDTVTLGITINAVPKAPSGISLSLDSGFTGLKTAGTFGTLVTVDPDSASSQIKYTHSAIGISSDDAARVDASNDFSINSEVQR